MVIKAVIFDMDGVIFDTEREYLNEWIMLFNEYGYKMEDNLYIPLMGTGRDNIKKTFKEHFGQDLPIEEMYIKKDKMLIEAVDKNKIALKEGAIELLDFLNSKNIKIALATSAKRERLEKQLKGANIKDKFQAIVSSEDVVSLKPDPEIFLKAAEKIGVNPENCIVIEDSTAGIKAAYNAKMIPIHVEDLKIADSEIKKYCFKYFKNLRDIQEFIILQ